MRPGVAGFLPGDIAAIDEDTAKRVQEADFTGAHITFQTYLTLFHRISSEPKQFWLIKGIWVTQSNAQYPFLVNKEDALRAKGVQAVQKMCQIACLLNAATLYVQPGRINPRGPWLPHPENTDPATVERLVSSLRGIASAAESEGVCLVLEGHVVSPLPTPEKV